MTKKDLKKMKRFKKFINACKSKKVYFVEIDNVLYVEDKIRKTKAPAPDEMQVQIFKDFVKSIYDGTDKEFIKKVEEIDKNGK